MKMGAEFQVGKFLDKFVSDYYVGVGYFEDLSVVGFRLAGGDLFYFKLEPCAQKVTLFFLLDGACSLTEHELLDINESLGFSEINLNGSVVFFEGVGLVYFNFVGRDVIDDEFLGKSVDALLSGYKELIKFIELSGS
ncbi:hypothetical protein SAMN04490194_1871 [Pseudomonas migulae]|uniref:Uncharacterized protein n=1 Tax=Pseudomonas migulae TaxID=78543 RepID=A0A1H5I3F4_9PSED|nr:hypothetical protein SAMN04490194_1871 [Pseudomonas migulae]